ncbi:MAG: hypothetical protein ACJ8HI_13885 [Massilia sp.]
MHLTGIIDAQAFRAKIMVVREALRHKPGQARPQPMHNWRRSNQLS